MAEPEASKKMSRSSRFEIERAFQVRTFGMPFTYLVDTVDVSMSGILLRGRHLRVPFLKDTLVELLWEDGGAKWFAGKIEWVRPHDEEVSNFGVRMIFYRGTDAAEWKSLMETLTQQHARPGVSTNIEEEPIEQVVREPVQPEPVVEQPPTDRLEENTQIETREDVMDGANKKRLAERLRQLKLTGMAEAMASVNLDLPAGQILPGLVSAQEASQTDARRAALVRAAKFSDELLEWATDHDGEHDDVWHRPDWIREGGNLYLWGDAGTGKSTIATAIGWSHCQHLLRVRYLRVADFVHEVAKAEDRGRLERYIAQLGRFDLLIIDDWGLVPLNSQQRAAMVRVIDQRLGRRSTLMVSCLPIDNWKPFLGDERVAQVLADRFRAVCEIIDVHGGSLRTAS